MQSPSYCLKGGYLLDYLQLNVSLEKRIEALTKYKQTGELSIEMLTGSHIYDLSVGTHEYHNGLWDYINYIWMLDHNQITEEQFTKLHEQDKRLDNMYSIIEYLNIPKDQQLDDYCPLLDDKQKLEDYNTYRVEMWNPRNRHNFIVNMLHNLKRDNGVEELGDVYFIKSDDSVIESLGSIFDKMTKYCEIIKPLKTPYPDKIPPIMENVKFEKLFPDDIIVDSLYKNKKHAIIIKEIFDLFDFDKQLEYHIAYKEKLNQEKHE